MSWRIIYELFKKFKKIDSLKDPKESSPCEGDDDSSSEQQKRNI